jgi:alkylhydroperoxidase family enzyme
MAYIRTIDPEDATGELKEQYDEAVKRAGRVYNVLRIQSLNPKEMAASTRFYEQLMLAPGRLSRKIREMLATVVSRELDCFY